MIRSLMAILLVLSCFVFTGCGNPEQEVTEKEAGDFGRQIEESIAKRQVTLMNEIIDKDGFKKKIVKLKADIPSDILSGVITGIRSTRLGALMIQTLGKAGTYKMVKQYNKDGVRHLVFRIFTGENLNYHDFELVKRGGTIKAADLYVYANGQHFSETMLESIGIVNDMPASSAMKANEFANSVKTMMGHVRNGEVEKAAKIYDKMPDDLKKQRLVQIIHIQISMGLDDEKYMDAIREFQELFPDSPNMYLLLIDKYFLKEDYKNALVNVNHLDSIINRDPFLDYYRSIIYEKMEDQENRQKSLEQLHQSMPEFVDGNINLINFYLEFEDDEKAVTLTEELIRTKKIKASDLESLFLLYPDYKKKLKI